MGVYETTWMKQAVTRGEGMSTHSSSSSSNSKFLSLQDSSHSSDSVELSLYSCFVTCGFLISLVSFLHFRFLRFVFFASLSFDSFSIRSFTGVSIKTSDFLGFLLTIFFCLGQLLEEGVPSLASSS